MTTARDRAFERAVRDYMARHHVPHSVARRALLQAHPAAAPARTRRVRAAAAAAAVPEDAVREAMFALAGQPAPRPGPGRRLADTLLDALDTVTSAPATPHDLHDVALDLGGEPVPPIAADVRGALAVLQTELTGMTGPILRDAVADLALPRWLVNLGIDHVHHGDRAGHAMLLDEWVREDAASEQGFTDHVVTALAAVVVDDHAAEHVLRWALRAHLASIGDLVLRLSAWPAADLAWQPAHTATVTADDDGGDRGLTAVARQPVPGAPEPLEVRLYTAPARGDTADLQPYYNAGTDEPAATGMIYQWSVGWRVDGRFVSYHHAGEPTREMAKLAAAALVHSILDDPARIKAPLAGRLLVPRTGEPAVWDDLRRVDLAETLDAVVAEHRSAAHEPFGTLPHQDDEGLNCVGLLLDHLSLPLPDRGSAANRARPDDPAFLSFFYANAITLSPDALAYLSALIDADHVPATIGARHTTAWRQLTTSHNVAGELGVLPAAITVADLATITTLTRWSHLRQPDHQPR